MLLLHSIYLHHFLIENRVSLLSSFWVNLEPNKKETLSTNEAPPIKHAFAMLWFDLASSFAGWPAS